jgi:hypothetical protein
MSVSLSERIWRSRDGWVLPDWIGIDREHRRRDGPHSLHAKEAVPGETARRRPRPVEVHGSLSVARRDTRRSAAMDGGQRGRSSVVCSSRRGEMRRRRRPCPAKTAVNLQLEGLGAELMRWLARSRRGVNGDEGWVGVAGCICALKENGWGA